MNAQRYVWSDITPDHPRTGVERRLVVGEQAMIARFFLAKGTVVPTHQHDNEQFACVLSGRIRFGIGADGTPDRRDVEIGAGEVLSIAAGIPHSADVLEDTVVLDVFAPPSERTGVDQ